ncbi:hypothetical protein AVEN_222974-1 [Araneus ventricosus]|uniref:Uncharacterized protein n=1 Tax=Araneus ventricosus TaxID=182803 RepID=A0A4Y2CMC1_ARAVE|nr:hypothetical protein AVEN_77106-1 [Araneus ventricosus]GBM04433.1 hypothetical protein AVEN_130460-1 [Araneus ventricosus]GBM04455.1 hypothetical protein AVEN_103727-1 [Araneus ventricosus]GBM04487.1 hypothetical protein AVEN_222974-1 [Araneus ventricosus]
MEGSRSNARFYCRSTVCGARCTLNHTLWPSPSRWCGAEAWSGTSAQASSSSSDRKSRGPYQNSTRVASKREVNVTKYQLLVKTADINMVPTKVPYHPFSCRMAAAIFIRVVSRHAPKRMVPDGAPAHKTSSVKQHLVEEFGKQITGYDCFQEWPPRSPDLTPMDFFL